MLGSNFIDLPCVSRKSRLMSSTTPCPYIHTPFYRADDSRFVVGNVRFRVDESAFVLVYIYARPHQPRIVAARHEKDKLFIGYVRRYYANVYPAYSGVFERLHKLAVYYKVRRCDINVPLRLI